MPLFCYRNSSHCRWKNSHRLHKKLLLPPSPAQKTLSFPIACTKNPVQKTLSSPNAPFLLKKLFPLPLKKLSSPAQKTLSSPIACTKNPFVSHRLHKKPFRPPSPAQKIMTSQKDFQGGERGLQKVFKTARLKQRFKHSLKMEKTRFF